MKTRRFSLHAIALCFLFVLGNAIFSLPISRVNVFSFILISCALNVGLIIIIRLLFARCKKNKFAISSFTILIFIAAVYGAITTFLDFYTFLSHKQMPHATTLLLFSFLLLIAVTFSTFRFSALLKYCLFIAIISAAIILVCFLLGIKNFTFSDFKTNFNKNAFSLNAFSKYFLPNIIFVLLLYLKSDLFALKNVVLGNVLGYATLLAIGLQVVLTLGFTYIDFEYFNAVSTLSTGSIFSRLDGLAFFVFFATAITKVIICVKTAALSTKRLLNGPI